MRQPKDKKDRSKIPREVGKMTIWTLNSDFEKFDGVKYSLEA
jgi:hypothetical protein